MGMGSRRREGKGMGKEERLTLHPHWLHTRAANVTHCTHALGSFKNVSDVLMFI